MNLLAKYKKEAKNTSRMKSRPHSNVKNLNMTHDRLLRRQNSDKFKKLRNKGQAKGQFQTEIGSKLLEENDISMIKKSVVVPGAQNKKLSKPSGLRSMFKFNPDLRSTGKNSLLNKILERSMAKG